MSRTRIIATALVAVVSLVAVGVGVAAQGNPGDGDVSLTAVFEDAGAIIPGNDVKIDGVKVGSVRNLEVIDGMAHMELLIGDDATPIFSDATASVRPVSLLGERFVDIDRGSPENDPIPDDGTIPVEQTSRSVDLDEVLSAVDDPTGTALAALVTALGDGIAGRGGEVSEALAVLEPSLTQTDQLVGLLDDQNALLLSLIESMAPVTDALGSNGGAELDAMVEATNALLTATADRAPELEATIQALPATIETARTALQEITTLADSTTPALEALEPLSSNFESFSNELQAFTDVANPALASLDPVLSEGSALLRSARPVVEQLRVAAPAAAADGEALRPILTEALGGIDHILNFLRNWALVTNGNDGISHYFRAHIVADATALGPLGLGIPSVTDLADLLVPEGNPAAAETNTNAAPSPDPVERSVASVEELLDNTGEAVEDLLGTGLTLQQTQRALTSLLGGGN